MKLLASGLASNFRPLITDMLNVQAGGFAVYQNMDYTTNIVTPNIDMTVRQAELASSTVALPRAPYTDVRRKRRNVIVFVASRRRSAVVRRRPAPAGVSVFTFGMTTDGFVVDEGGKKMSILHTLAPVRVGSVGLKPTKRAP
ncbi:hypothetical protein EVAR_157_1 [Eumeta japonica]|uniref:Uncharacterized protein n=1 Tax=Eumeta variegata TaxID=151549 RepID=A0A4C1S8S7_EUMVA|nr:hypothetical protein EVAR_157_1 [Eumeta japonica]